MTAPNGFPADMDPFALDTGTAERLVAGSLDAGDAPPEYRGVAQTLQALRQPADSAELAGAPETVERIAAAVVVARHARPEPRPKRSPAPRGQARSCRRLDRPHSDERACGGGRAARVGARRCVRRAGQGGDFDPDRRRTAHRPRTAYRPGTAYRQERPTGHKEPTVGVPPTTAAPSLDDL